MKRVILSAIGSLIICGAIVGTIQYASYVNLKETRETNKRKAKHVLQHNDPIEFSDDSLGFYGIIAINTEYVYENRDGEQCIITKHPEIAKEIIDTLYANKIEYKFKSFEDKHWNSDTATIKYRITYYKNTGAYIPVTTYNRSTVKF